MSPSLSCKSCGQATWANNKQVSHEKKTLLYILIPYIFPKQPGFFSLLNYFFVTLIIFSPKWIFQFFSNNPKDFPNPKRPSCFPQCHDPIRASGNDLTQASGLSPRKPGGLCWIIGRCSKTWFIRPFNSESIHISLKPKRGKVWKTIPLCKRQSSSVC